MLDMPIKLENVGIAVRDLEETIAFFTDLGLTVLGRDTVSGEWTDTAVGLDGNHAKIAMLQTPDGAGHLDSSSTSTPPQSRRRPRCPMRLACTASPSQSTTSRRPSRLPHGTAAIRCAAWLRMKTLQAHLCPRPQRHHRHARRGAEEELTPAGARAVCVIPLRHGRPRHVTGALPADLLGVLDQDRVPLLEVGGWGVVAQACEGEAGAFFQQSERHEVGVEVVEEVGNGAFKPSRSWVSTKLLNRSSPSSR